jgi:ribulose-bisphosphate carboxylase large chain
MLTDRIEADYLLETPIAPERAAEIIAGEQSSGTRRRSSRSGPPPA